MSLAKYCSAYERAQKCIQIQIKKKIVFLLCPKNITYNLFMFVVGFFSVEFFK